MAEVGSPSVSSGTSTPAAAALFAASGPATPSIAPLPNSSGVLATAASRSRRRGRSGSPRRRPAARRSGSRARCRAATASTSAASPRGVIQTEPRTGIDCSCRRVSQAGGDVERLADREQADRDDDDVDAVEQLRDAEGEARLPGQACRCRPGRGEPEEQATRSPRTSERAEQRGHRDEGQHHQREVLGRPELRRRARPPRRERRSAQRARSCRRRTSRSPRWPAPAAPRPRLAIWLPSSAVDDRGRLARRVEQDRGGRAAVHAAVVDAGEHDEGAGRARGCR